MCRAKFSAYLQEQSKKPLRDLWAAKTYYRQTFLSWDDAQNWRRPVYCLPESTIDALGSRFGRFPPLFDKPTVEAELAYADLCASSASVGWWENGPINNWVLGPRPPMPSLPTNFASSPNPSLVAKHLISGSADIRTQLKGYIGFLLTEPDFLQDMDNLCQAWEKLQDRSLLFFPLNRGADFHLGEVGLNSPRFPKLHFVRQLQGYLQRWSLSCLPTFDLPDPQGPLIPNPLPSNSPANPSHGTHIVIPKHLAVVPEDLSRQILACQKSEALEANVSEQLVAMSNWKIYGTIFDVLHLERTIRSRFHSNRIRFGAVSQINGVIAETLHLEVTTVEKYRKDIATCKRGARNRVERLQTRNR